MALSPAAHAHLDQARHNYALFTKLRAEGEYRDRALTALFHTALHLVMAHAVEQRAPLDDDHSSLRRHVAESLGTLRLAYRRLEDGSRDTRYDLLRPDEALLDSYHDREYGHIASQMRNRGYAF